MNRFRNGPALLLAALLLAGALTATGVGVAAGAAQPAADNTVTRIELAADGSATWVVRVRTRLETEADVREFERFRETFRGNESDSLDRFRDRITGVVGNAANETGREMSAVDFSASTSIQEVPRRWGVVTYRFRWLHFARVDDERVVAGDAFGSGFYIAERDALEVVVPPGYRAATVAPSPGSRDGRTLTWEGPESFADGRPRVVAEPTPEPTTEPSPAGGDGGPADGERGPDDGEQRPADRRVPYAVGALTLAAFALVTVLYVRRRSTLPADSPGPRPPSPSDGGDAAGSEAVAGGEDTGAEAPEGEAAEGETTAGGEAAPRGGMDGDADPLLTDEDRVLALLEERGGRIKQATVADALDWSSSKTSRAVRGMAESGRIEKLRIGRENVLQVPESDEGDERADGGR